MADSKSTFDSKTPATTADTPVVETVNDGDYFAEIDEAYLHTSPFTKFYRGTLLQMILFGW